MGEHLWNQRLRGKAGVDRVFRVNAAVAARERVENTASGIGGGVPSAPSSVKALRCAPTAARRAEGRAALTDASAAGVCWS